MLRAAESWSIAERTRLAATMTARTIGLCVDETFHDGMLLVAQDLLSGYLLVEKRSERRDALALRGAASGEYVVEIVRGRGDGPVSGEVTVRVAGAQRKIPFTLSGARTAVAIVRISQESRLVPVR